MPGVMNQRGLQLSLFGRCPTLPSRSFPRYSTAFDDIRICTAHERQIIARRTAGGQVLREFVFAENTAGHSTDTDCRPRP